MKKYFLFLCTLIILGACTNTIGYLPDDEPRKLIVNAMMKAGDDDNRVYLHYTGWTATTPVTDGIVRLYINGKLAETITAEGHYYPVKSIFRTGDRVNIEASAENGEFTAKAETRISAPLQIMSVDTSYISLRDYNGWVGNKPIYDNYLRLKIQLKQPHIEEENMYYRLEIQQVSYSHRWYDGSDTLSIDTTYNYNYIYDTALTDGKPGHAIDEGFELIQKWNNYFGLFKSSYFKNEEYAMTVDLKEDINYIHMDSHKAERYISVRFYSISESEYRYLHAMSSSLDFDAENFIYAVPLIPSDIEGGIGIFGIANQTEYKLKEENCQDKQ